jgi:DNA helicase-2/ATP-dependent DNA helicase PcrA
LNKLSKVLEKICAQDMDSGTMFDTVFDYYRPIMKEKFDDWQARSNDLEAVKQMASRYDSLKDFLADFTIEPPERAVAKVEPLKNVDERPLVLSTIHSAKGLEWESVFLIGLVEGILPVSFSLDDEESLEEEQRLFYVGVTRAKKQLILSLHHEGSGFGLNQFNKVSRFLDSPNVLSRLDQSIMPAKEEEW